ncbi:hypothetical protein [Bradyrhizobium canariense]|uniref:DUF680 domain-containing protein n=1 Tax=Bradyrhizobium canariense TaxID=255045 RepID=A0A1H1QSH0_9BRAD|nr:hypothetical protein [Bradyrhizobium canariense]SDS26374.1 hypothetical protein SAMN05444158_1517 [Bradyrhizobium canariense]
MYKRLASITGTFALLAASVLATGRAEAGASASAPSKYSHTNQVSTVHQARVDRQARKHEGPITEFSSSSARNSGQKK